jgi:hypothetical protein
MTTSAAGYPPPPAFSLLAAPAGGGTPVLGLWAPPAPPPPDAYGLADDAGQAEPTWRASLPGDAAGAAAALAGAEAVLAASERSLPVAASRLERLAAGLGSEAAYAVPTGEVPGQPEIALWAALDDLEGPSPGDQSVSFGPLASVSGAWDRAAAGFREYCAQMRGLVVRETLVETEVGGRLLARTSLGRSGGTATAWRAGIGADDAALHGRTVALALASREEMLRILVLAVRGARLLAATAAGPGGVLLALPAAWRFVEDVRAEAGATRARREEAGSGR